MRKSLLWCACIVAVCANASGAQARRWQVAMDQGTGLSPAGIVALPGMGVSPFASGTTVTGANVAETALDGSGKPHPVIDGQDALGSAVFGGVISIQYSAFADQTQATGFISPDGSHVHAAVFGSSNGPWAWEDANPPGYVNSADVASDGVLEQIGWAQDASGRYSAYVFDDPPGRALLLANGFTGAAGAGMICEGSQRFGFIGYGWSGGAVLPLYWANAETPGATVLPSWASQGMALAADFKDQSCGFGGAAMPVSGKSWHAALWSYVSGGWVAADLHPAGHYEASVITTMRRLAGTPHALLEAGYATKRVRGATILHAMIWRGSSASAVDLNGKLPAGFVQSVATGIDEQGNVQGAAADAGGVWHSVRWAVQ